MWTKGRSSPHVHHLDLVRVKLWSCRECVSRNTSIGRQYSLRMIVIDWEIDAVEEVELRYLWNFQKFKNVWAGFPLATALR
jgi:hypothetical protein